MSDDALLKEVFGDLPEGSIVLLETSVEKSLNTGIGSVKIMAKNNKGSILSASRPCSNLLNLYQKNGIDTKNLFIFCCLCNSQGVKADSTRNVMHLEGPSNLTNISICLNKRMNNKDDRFVFIDSVTSMLIHNKPDVFAKFVHNILTKMRNNNVSGILVSLEGETNKEVRAEIAQLCDKVVKV